MPPIRFLSPLVGCVLLAAGCAPADARDRSASSAASPVAVETVAEGLVPPWGLPSCRTAGCS